MKYIAIPFIVFFFSFSVSAQQPVHTVFLVGDAGKDATPGPSLQLVQEQLKTAPNGSVVFLGDNIYPSGLHLSNKAGDTTQSERNLLCQLQVVQQYAGNIFFVPGNHDWNAGNWGGLKGIKAQEKYVESYRPQGAQISKDPAHSIQFAPTAGLPGPESFSPVKGLRFVFIDTQWFLHFHKKDKLPGKSKKETAKAFYNAVDSTFKAAETANERIVIFYHHPLFTNGGHGTGKEPLRFLINYTPFQLLLGLPGGNRLMVQDIPQPRFKKMRKKLLEIESRYKGVINASGHEHYLQFFQEGDDHFIVSGSGSKLSHRKMDKYNDLFYEDKQGGFAKLLYYADGKVVVEFWGAADKKVLKSFELK